MKQITALAVDLSYGLSSLAVLRNGTVLLEDSWEEEGRKKQLLFRKLAIALKELEMTVDDIEMFAAGIGPGAYSGLRIAIASVCGLAAPGGKTVYGVSVGEAIASELQFGGHGGTLAVIGDARRQRLWGARFVLGGDQPKQEKEYELIDIPRLESFLEGVSVLVSPEWNRLSEIVKSAAPADLEILEKDHFPVARHVGLMAVFKAATERPPRTIAPIYLHPAVARRS